MFSKRLTWTLVIVYVMVQLLSTMAIIVLQLDARAARADAAAQRHLMQKQNDAIFCVLQITPSERTDALIKKCREDNLNK